MLAQNLKNLVELGYQKIRAKDSDIPINSIFRKHSERIIHCLKSYNRTVFGEENRYSNLLDAEILKDCTRHRDALKTKNNNSSLVAMVHPFYLPLTHSYFINNMGMLIESQDYLTNLFNFLEENRQAPSERRYHITVLDTIHHYSAGTSLLLEENLVNDAVFTVYDNGMPLEKKDLALGFRGKKVYACGGYNEHCFSNALGEIRMYVNNEDLRIIEELVLDSPISRNFSLLPRNIISNSSKEEGNCMDGLRISINEILESIF